MKIILLSLFISFSAFAQTPSPSKPGAAQVQQIAQSIQGSKDLSTDSFISDAIQAVGQFNQAGLPVGLKIALIVLMIIALMKVSFLQPMWNKLGNFKAAAAPILGLIVGFILYSNGQSFNLASALAFFASGVGAAGLHEILDMIKAIPGIGATYVGIINMIEQATGGGK